MKVLFLNYEYPPLGGGAGNATACLLARYSGISDLEIDLVTSGISGKYELEKVGENIRVHKLPIGKNPKNIHFQSQKDLLTYSWKAFWFCRKYSNRPLHLFGGSGIILSLLGLAILFWMAIEKIFFGQSLSEKIWPLVGTFFVMIGVQLFIFGLLADILIKNYYKSQKRMNYSVKEVVEQ